MNTFWKIKLFKLIRLLLCVAIVIFFVQLFLYYNRKNFFYYGHQKEASNQKVYVIGKAAIGQYLWLHILNGEIEYLNNGFYQTGNKTIFDTQFIYLSGPGYIQNTIPQNIEFMILVLNGRSYEKVLKAKEWLDFLNSFKSLKKVAVLLLGNERCENEWIMKYMKSKGGVVNLLFIVYDTEIVDNKEILQWPLGVATYRGFPNINKRNVKHILRKRKFKCNFLGTVYKNSSREMLLSTLRNDFLKNMCYIMTRRKWLPNEPRSSLQLYIDIIQNSDLTLSPAGMNTECYRIYEAMSLGSVPVIEDVKTSGICDSPLRILKKYKAPAIYVKSWENLSTILLHDINLSDNLILERRKMVLLWYSEFKKALASKFIDSIRKSFFGE